MTDTFVLESYHHTNIYNIMLRIGSPISEHTAKIAFIGHKTCKNDDHDGTPPYNGLTYKSLRLITVMNFSSAASETRTTVHEIGHLFGAPDHYGGSAESTDDIILRTGDDRFNEYCMYGERKNESDVTNNLIICEGCKARIAANAGDYN